MPKQTVPKQNVPKQSCLNKTNRVRQKRLFIEERLSEVSPELKKMEKELREFREFNRNISGSPYLEMKVQEMGREIDLQNSLYVTLKTQHEKAKIDEIERDDMVQIIDGPNIPAKLTFPRRGLILILSLFFGFFLAVFSMLFSFLVFFSRFFFSFLGFTVFLRNKLCFVIPHPYRKVECLRLYLAFMPYIVPSLNLALMP